ncbi:hypothetical protein MPSEU_000227100 [Mayamaea pseudoterrestris]|nr:hypothetical protein MPSEU_000227100 [Mayamaea pseudoterrestris]
MSDLPTSNMPTSTDAFSGQTTDAPTTGEAASGTPIMEKVHVGVDVASDLFVEAKARLEEAAREFDSVLKSKNPDNKLDAGWQVAEDTFNAARNTFQQAIDSFKSQFENKGDEDKSLVDKTTAVAGSGVELVKAKLYEAKTEFEKASADLRDRIKAKEQENQLKKAGEEFNREAKGVPEL